MHDADAGDKRGSNRRSAMALGIAGDAHAARPDTRCFEIGDRDAANLCDGPAA